MAEEEVEMARPAVIVHYEPTYQLKPSEESRFYPSIARRICEAVTTEVLDKKSWRGEEETVWSVQIAEQVKARVRQEMHIPRYKVVVQVTIGEMKNQGVRVASKCLWDADSDNYASYSFQNESLWCCVMVFCCYTE